MATPTTLTVRVIANDGKFLGDDIGGAAITIRDCETQELLAAGVTRGDSGPNGTKSNGNDGVMCVKLTRGTPLPVNPLSPTSVGTCAFTATLPLNGPRRVQVTAFGPLAARASANTVSVTTWLYPGLNLTAGNGLLLELPGLICQVVSPPAHAVWTLGASSQFLIANVAMMCGCPISRKPADLICVGAGNAQPWPPDEFQVFAEVQQVVSSPQIVPLKVRVALTWDKTTAGRFTAPWPKELVAGTYQVTVAAQQARTGNTGVDFSTVIVQAAA